MIRLLLTFVACLALQSAAPGAAAAWGHEPAAIGVAGGAAARVVLPSSLDAASLVAVLPAAAGGAGAPSFVAVDAGALRSHAAVARLWLRGARLLC